MHQVLLLLRRDGAPATETPAEGEGDDREDGPWLPVAQRTQRVAFCPCPTNSVRTH